MNSYLALTALAAFSFVAPPALAQVVPRAAIIEHFEYSTKYTCSEGLPDSKTAAFKEYSYFEMPQAARKACGNSEPFSVGPITYDITCKVDRFDDGHTLYVHRLVARARAMCPSP